MNLSWKATVAGRSTAPAPIESMFREDLNLYCLPHSQTDRNSPFRVYVHGNTKNEDRTWSLIEGLSDRNTWSKREMFADAYRQIIMHLADRGEWTFRLQRDEQGGQSIMPSRHRHYLRRYGPICITTEPDPDTNWVDGKVIRRVSRTKDTWTIRLPNSIQKPMRYRSMLKDLRCRSLGFGDNIAHMIASGNVPVSEYTSLSDSSLLQTCSEWRWDGRMGTSDRLNDFYRVFLNLSWRRNMAVLREHIVLELNTLLRRLNYGTRFGVCGLLTSEQYTEALGTIFNRENGLDGGYDAILLRGKYASYANWR